MSIVIAAIDNSLAAQPVLQAAGALAEALGASVEAIHVEEAPGHTAQATASSLGVAFQEIPGEAVAQIAARATAHDAVAVVVGARRHLQGGHIGHTALAIADRIDKPVLVVPPEAHPADHVARVVIAMEGTPSKARSLKSAVEVAAGADLEVVVVHVDDEASIPSFSDQAAYETEAYAEEFLARYAPGVPHARFEPRVGLPADEILAVSESIEADLVAVGWPQSSEGGRGMVARQVLDRSHVPVLLVALA